MHPRVGWTITVLALGTAAAITNRALERRHRRMQAIWEGDEAFDELDDVVEPEPAGIVYDQRMPCVARDGTILVSDEEGCIHPKDLAPLPVDNVPFAQGHPAPAWPLITDHPRSPQVSYIDAREKWHGRWGREFGATRRSRDRRTGKTVERRHAGVDLFADEGDTVVAMEPGEVIAILPFHHGAWAIYVLNDTGDVINYGEIQKGSWWRFGIRQGSRVTRGQRLATLGKMRTDTMLHVETYENGGDVEALVDDIRAGGMRWVSDQGAPHRLLDPTQYLLDAQRVALGERVHPSSPSPARIQAGS